MKIQDIEQAVMKQLPSKRYHEPGKEDIFFNRPGVKKDRFLDIGMLMICGLSSVYIPDAQKRIVAHYDVDNKSYIRNVNAFGRHLNRVSEIINEYGAYDYKSFSDLFWRRHNNNTAGEPLRSGIILSHVVSSKREFTQFIRDNPVFTDEDYFSFFIYNKAQLAKNYLSLNFPLKKNRPYVDHLLSF